MPEVAQEAPKIHLPDDCPCGFAHLHQHTQFSLLDGAARLKDLVKWVKKVSPENPMMAMTDHGNMFGAVQFYKYATEAGVKPIIGYEAYVAADSRFDRKMRRDDANGGYFHLTMLAKNMEGYQNLSRLSSRAYLEGFYQKPRIDRQILKEHNEGLIILSGCLGSEIQQFILEEKHDLAETRLQEYLSIFGEDRYFIEIQDHGMEEQKKVNPVLLEFAQKYGLGVVATNDGHYVHKEDAEAHAVALAIQSKTTWEDPKRWKFPCDEFYVKTPQEMVDVFKGQKSVWGNRYDELFRNSVDIANMCNVDLVPKTPSYRIPKFPLPEGRSEVSYFRELTFAGLLKRYPDRISEDTYREFLRKAGKVVPHGDAESLVLAIADIDDLEVTRSFLPELANRMAWTTWEVMSRTVYELTIIEKMGFPAYLLIVWDFINWAKDNGISVGPGRGSAAGSVATFATRITNIDPLKYDLLFERFLNPARVSMPDIDTDFSDVRRIEVIDYTRRRYGEDKVAQIGTFGTLASKAALKDAARVFGLSVAKTNELTKLIPSTFGKPMPLEEAVRSIPDLRAEMERDPVIKRVIEIAQRLEGLNRNTSVHAAGVVISDVPLQDYLPLMRVKDGDGKVTQYDMNSVESLGFLKMDFLGLRCLSLLDECKRIVLESKGDVLDFDDLPVDDPLTFELLGRGETKGIFQMDSAGMTASVRGLKPRRIQDIIAVAALYRPGPMEHIPTYIARHHGREEVTYPKFPKAEALVRPILEETYGIPVYQEQIMQLASAAAGYSLGDADLLRRAMGKKKIEEMAKQRVQFKAGAAVKGIPGDQADALFDLLEAFANYGFNKSHSAAYAVLTYQTAWVKAHYPVEFHAALLSVERGDSDKVAEYIRAARSTGVSVLPPNINKSGFLFTAEGQDVLFGLSAVKNVGEVPTEAIVQSRLKGGKFKSFADFLKRVDERVANKRVVESLIKAGAFDEFGSRGAMLATMEETLKWAQSEREMSGSGMVGLFGESPEPELPNKPILDPVTQLKFEKESLGIYVTGHPLSRYSGLREAASTSIEELPLVYKNYMGERGRARLLLSGMVEGIVRKPTKSGGMLIRFTLGDESGATEVVAFGRAYDKISPRLVEDSAILAVVEVEPDSEGQSLRVMAQEIVLHEELQGFPRVFEIEMDLVDANPDKLLELRSRLDDVPGRHPVQIKLTGPDGWAIVDAREIKTSEEAMGIMDELEWASAKFIPDGEGILASTKPAPRQWGKKDSGPADAAIPF